MEHKLVMDTSGDILSFEGIDFTAVPMKVMAGEREFVDNEQTNVADMVEYFKSYKGKSSTACPSVGEFLEAFGDAQNVYCVTITSNLSGSYNAALIAAQTYEEQHPGRRAHVFDSLSTGPEMLMLAEKIRELVDQGLPFDEIVRLVHEYHENTHLLFSLECLNNLANNGRVPMVVAKATGILGIRLIGHAKEGRLHPTHKARGEKKVVPTLMDQLEEMGCNGKKIRIAHCFNESGANALAEAIRVKYPDADIAIGTTRCLCSFYAELGGILMGFES